MRLPLGRSDFSGSVVKAHSGEITLRGAGTQPLGALRHLGRRGAVFFAGGENQLACSSRLRKHHPATKSKRSKFWGSVGSLQGGRKAASTEASVLTPTRETRQELCGTRPKSSSAGVQAGRSSSPMSWDTGQYGATGLPRATLQKSGKPRAPKLSRGSPRPRVPYLHLLGTGC